MARLSSKFLMNRFLFFTPHSRWLMADRVQAVRVDSAESRAGLWPYCCEYYEAHRDGRLSTSEPHALASSFHPCFDNNSFEHALYHQPYLRSPVPISSYANWPQTLQVQELSESSQAADIALRHAVSGRSELFHPPYSSQCLMPCLELQPDLTSTTSSQLPCYSAHPPLTPSAVHSRSAAPYYSELESLNMKAWTLPSTLNCPKLDPKTRSKRHFVAQVRSHVGFETTIPEELTSHEKQRMYIEALEEYIYWAHQRLRESGQTVPSMTRVDRQKEICSRSLITVLVHFRDYAKCQYMELQSESQVLT
ncbi:hypothetical protein BC629DRAFT_1599962 [Irpex lacteus]|nr:hypothetical protein BC629DRAFT_1599962 [Irpex lacteus]